MKDFLIIPKFLELEEAMFGGSNYSWMGKLKDAKETEEKSDLLCKLPLWISYA